MKKDFLIEKQGKTFALYAGVLDQAHEQGLREIRTDVVQLPTEANGMLAVVKARAILEREGRETSFDGIGDASPANVSPLMKSHILRTAETRAKARALRDAVNIGVTVLEELADDDSASRPPGNGSGREMAPADAPTRDKSNVYVDYELGIKESSSVKQLADLLNQLLKDSNLSQAERQELNEKGKKRMASLR